jgi:hypothetical protein
VIAVIGEVVRGAVGEHEARGREDGAVLIIVGLEGANEPERSTMSRGGATKGLDRLLGIEDRASVAVGAIGRVKVLNRNALFAKLRNRKIRVLHAGPATQRALDAKAEPARVLFDHDRNANEVRLAEHVIPRDFDFVVAQRQRVATKCWCGQERCQQKQRRRAVCRRKKKKKKKKNHVRKKKKKTEKQTKSNLEFEYSIYSNKNRFKSNLNNFQTYIILFVNFEFCNGSSSRWRFV